MDGWVEVRVKGTGVVAQLMPYDGSEPCTADRRGPDTGRIPCGPAVCILVGLRGPGTRCRYHLAQHIWRSIEHDARSMRAAADARALSVLQELHADELERLQARVLEEMTQGALGHLPIAAQRALNVA
jgi:hypothetical protein